MKNKVNYVEDFPCQISRFLSYLYFPNTRVSKIICDLRVEIFLIKNFRTQSFLKLSDPEHPEFLMVLLKIP